MIIRRKFSLAIIAIFSLAVASGLWLLSAQAEAAAGMTVQGLDAMTRIGRTGTVSGTSQVHIYAARNEVEPFQVIVSADGQPLTNVNATFGVLTGPGGVTLTDIALFRQHAVTTTQATPHSQYGVGVFFDALIPFVHPTTGAALNGPVYDAVPFAVRLGEHQPLWIDVSVPADAVAGDYTGSVVVSADGLPSQSLSVTLTVWDFTLPETPLMPSSIGLSWRRVAEAYGLHVWNDAGEVFPLARQYYDFLLDHSLSPGTFHTTAPDYNAATGEPTFDVQTYDTAGTAAANLDYYLNQKHASSYSLEFFPTWPYADPLSADRTAAQRFVGESAKYLADNGYTVTPHLYWIDEPNDATAYQDVRDWGAFFDEAEATYGVEIPMLITEAPTPDNAAWGTLVGAVDIWAPWVGDVWVDEDHRNTDAISARIAAGEPVWSYAALAYYPTEYGDANGWPATLTDNHPPIWQLDYAPINYRIIPWLNQLYGITGLLYWDTLTWQSGQDVWQTSAYFTNDNIHYHNGDGFLIYPMHEIVHDIDAPAASLRLKWIRESADDYAYIALLKARGDTTFAHTQIETFARNMADWDDDTDALYAARLAMGHALSGSSTSVTLTQNEVNHPSSGVTTTASILLLCTATLTFWAIRQRRW